MLHVAPGVPYGIPHDINLHLFLLPCSEADAGSFWPCPSYLLAKILMYKKRCPSIWPFSNNSYVSCPERKKNLLWHCVFHIKYDAPCQPLGNRHCQASLLNAFWLLCDTYFSFFYVLENFVHCIYDGRIRFEPLTNYHIL